MTKNELEEKVLSCRLKNKNNKTAINYRPISREDIRSRVI